MATSPILSNDVETVEDLVYRLGDIPLRRIRMKPLPGTATVEDLIALAEAPRKVLCELIDGVLVEKEMGFRESFLAGLLLQYINNFLESSGLGIATAPDGPVRILLSQVRLPDVSVFLWESLPGETFPKEKVPALVPDIAVEVISEGNTKREVQRKLKDYFLAGVKQVWVIYPKTRSAHIYSSPEKPRRVGPKQSLTGGDILPGFELPLARLFARMKKPKKS